MIFVSVCQNITTLPLNSWGMIYSFLSKSKYELFAIQTQPCSSVKQKACCPNLDFIAPKYKERPIPHASCISCTLWLFQPGYDHNVRAQHILAWNILLYILLFVKPPVSLFTWGIQEYHYICELDLVSLGWEVLLVGIIRNQVHII